MTETILVVGWLVAMFAVCTIIVRRPKPTMPTFGGSYFEETAKNRLTDLNK